MSHQESGVFDSWAAVLSDVAMKSQATNKAPNSDVKSKSIKQKKIPKAASKPKPKRKPSPGASRQ